MPFLSVSLLSIYCQKQHPPMENKAYPPSKKSSNEPGSPPPFPFIHIQPTHVLLNIELENTVPLNLPKSLSLIGFINKHSGFVTGSDIWHNPLTGKCVLHFIVENKHANRFQQMAFLASGEKAGWGGKLNKAPGKKK